MILVCYWFVLFWKTMSHTLVKEDLNFGSSQIGLKFTEIPVSQPPESQDNKNKRT